MSTITFILSDKLSKEQLKISKLLGDYEQPYFGNTILEMVKFEVVNARQELRDKVMKGLGCEYHYIECNIVKLSPIEKKL